MTNAKTWITAVLFFLAATLLCGVLYTAAVTGIAQLLFPQQANGSIIEVNGTKYGSTLVGQDFSDEKHLWGRPTNANAHTFTDAAGNPLMWYGAWPERPAEVLPTSAPSSKPAPNSRSSASSDRRV